MLEKVKNEFKFHSLSPEEKEKRHILGRLEGIIADYKDPTRNGRLYTEELWEKVFQSDIMKEKIAAHAVLGELGHPEDRTETDISKAAICLAEVPKKNEDGNLIGVFDILDTPSGRILMTLCEYGTKIGISSRGEGDVNMDYQGNEIVDPDTYNCECWDAVLVPSVKEARLDLVESIDGKGKGLKKALTETLNRASRDDREEMQKSLKRLNIDLNGQLTAAGDSRAEGNILTSLKEAIKKNSDLQSQLKKLKEDLSVSYAKERELTSTWDRTLAENRELARDLSKAEDEIARLNEELDERDNIIKSHESSLADADEALQDYESLTESYGKSRETIRKLQEAREEEGKINSKKLKNLTEDYEELRKNSDIQITRLNEKLQKANKDLSTLTSLFELGRDKYIALKAQLLGISFEDYTRRLGENYSFNDVDRIYDELRASRNDHSNQPNKSPQSRKIASVELRESQTPAVRAVVNNNKINGGSDLDSDLLRMASKYLQ